MDPRHVWRQALIVGQDTKERLMTRVVPLLAAFVPVAALMTGATISHGSAGDGSAAAIAAGKLPAGYRDWRLISVAREEGDLDDIRAVLGNDIAIDAYRANRQPFPDGTIIARLAWSYDSAEENNKSFGREQSFVAGHPKNGVQFMVKDTTRYASTGGWLYAQFDDGTPVKDEKQIRACFVCHQAITDRDYVFTRYAK
jgi:hypothetical protein